MKKCYNKVILILKALKIKYQINKLLQLFQHKIINNKIHFSIQLPITMILLLLINPFIKNLNLLKDILSLKCLHLIT